MYIYLDIVEQFACRMCGTCCRNDWQVTVDQATYQRNAVLFAQMGGQEEFGQAFQILAGRQQPGEFAAIAKQPGSTNCWFLTGQNLCRLHRVAGHAHLDAVCQTYPRYPMTSARGIELTLSFSCPAVLELVRRQQPLRLLKSAAAPIAFVPEQYTEQVFPRQKRQSDPLRYYFELEQHVIDILQCRQLTVPQRLELLALTVRQIEGFGQDENLGSLLNQLFWRNYDTMEAGTAAAAEGLTAAILAEHFFVNFVFKKPFYAYGLQQTLRWLETFWHRIAGRVAAAAPANEWQAAQTAIVELELRYGHQRSLLLSAGQSG